MTILHLASGTLPADLDSSSARNPALFAYVAAQNRLGAPVLFSHKKIGELIDPARENATQAAGAPPPVPEGLACREGIDDRRLVNQMANYALLEWPENLDIRDKPPIEYVAAIKPRFSHHAWAQMCELHALPEDWQEMDYADFLEQRRHLMADIIRRGFESLR